MKRSRVSVTSFLMRESWRESTALGTGVVALTAALGQLAISDANANPEGGSVVAGEASIDATASDEVTINQSSSRAVIEWDSFSIAEGEHTRFVQPDADAVTLNRVIGDDLSRIAGRLTANGKIILVNPNGLLFTGTAEVNVGSLIASTSDVDNDDILDETNSIFAFGPGSLSGSVINDGDVTVAEGGLAAFVAPYVRNNGSITARLGRVTLASGDIFTLDLNGDGLTQLELSDDIFDFEFSERDGSVEVTGDGLIEADGGLVLLSVSDASTLIDETINMDGVIRARSVETREGRIILGGRNSETIVRGTIDAAGLDADTIGGNVELRGERVVLTNTSNIEASGPLGGGTILIGQEADATAAIEVDVEDGAFLRADAGTEGNGGRIEVVAEESLQFRGSGSANAGAEGGDGGLIALVSEDEIDVTNAQFEASAPSGNAGELRLHADDINVIDLDALTFEETTGSDTISVDTISDDTTVAGPFILLSDESSLSFEPVDEFDLEPRPEISDFLLEAIRTFAELPDLDLSGLEEGAIIDIDRLRDAVGGLAEFADVDLGGFRIDDEASVEAAIDLLSRLSNRSFLNPSMIERTLDSGTSVAILAGTETGGELLIASDIEHRGGRDVSFDISAGGDVTINGTITSTGAPMSVGVESSGTITFSSIASSLADAVETVLSGFFESGVLDHYDLPLPGLPDGAIETAGRATLKASGDVTAADVTAAAIDITSNGFISGRTATADLELTSSGFGGIGLTNTGDATLSLVDGPGFSTFIENIGNLQLAKLEAEGSGVDVEINATGNIDSIAAIGTDDAPLDYIWLIAGGDLKVNGAVTAYDQFLSGNTVTLAGRYRTDGGSFDAGDIDRDSAFIIDGTSGPVVIDTTGLDVDDSYESAPYNSITFNGTLDGTNTGADALVLRVGDGDVSFNRDVGSNVPIGTLSIESNAIAIPVAVSNLTTDEDDPVALAIDPPGGTFGSLTISGLPIGSRLDDGINSAVTIETDDQIVDLERFALDSLRLAPPQNSDGLVKAQVTLTVRGSNEVNRPASGVFEVINFIDGSRAESDFTVTVAPIVDGTTIRTTESDWSGNRLPVQIDATLLDNDGSETAIILIDDLPEGTTLSAGTQNSDGSFSLTLAELDNLELVSANDGDPISALTVSATTTEANDPDQTLTSASITLAIPERPVSDPVIPPLPTTSEIGSRIVLEGATQQGPIGDALRPNRLPDASPILTASRQEDASQDAENPADPFSVEPAAGGDSAGPEAWEACPDIVDASVSWQNTASDAAFNVNPNLVPYSVDVYCGGYQMTAAGRGVSEDYEGLSFVSRDFWTDLKQERTPSVIEELRPTPSTY